LQVADQHFGTNEPLAAGVRRCNLVRSAIPVESLVSSAVPAQPGARSNSPSSVAALARRVRADPLKAVGALRALALGYLCRALYRLLGRRFRAGRNFRLFGWLSVRGPGEVILGDDVVIRGRPRLWTYSRDARIIIGDRVTMGAAAFGCVKEIRVGRMSILSRVQIRDTDFHSLTADRHSDQAPVRVASVHIGDNVWIGDRVGILPGTRIGDNSVVSFGAVCGREYPPNVIIMGNPAKVAAPIPGRSQLPEG
jgi:acetyltransferase-like isoleucine patch superfamily enzyme